MIYAGIAAPIGRKRVPGSPGNLQKIPCAGRFFDAVSHDPGQFLRRGTVFLLYDGSILHGKCLRGIQSIWRDKPGIFTSQFHCFLVHQRRKCRHGLFALLRAKFRRVFVPKLLGQKTLPHIFRQRHGRIIVGFQHQGMKQVPDPVLLSFLYV